jgi:hypothetical protein
MLRFWPPFLHHCNSSEHHLIATVACPVTSWSQLSKFDEHMAPFHQASEVVGFVYGLIVLAYFVYQSWLDTAWQIINGYPSKYVTPTEEEIREGEPYPAIMFPRLFAHTGSTPPSLVSYRRHTGRSEPQFSDTSIWSPTALCLEEPLTRVRNTRHLFARLSRLMVHILPHA